MPQIARTVSLAEDLATRMSAPIDQVVPGLTRLADTLASPVFASLPTDLSAFLDAINDLVRRMSPLGQLAESATGLFGLRIPGVAAFDGPGDVAGWHPPRRAGAVRRARAGTGASGSERWNIRRREGDAGEANDACQTQAAAATKGGGEAQAAGEDGGSEAQAPVQPPLTPQPASPNSHRVCSASKTADEHTQCEFSVGGTVSLRRCPPAGCRGRRCRRRRRR